MQYLGWPYIWGGASPADGGFDCSGIVQYAYGQVGVSVPRTTWDQANFGISVSFDALVPGDVIITSGGGHEVLFVGDVDGVPTVLQFQQPGTNGMLTPLSEILNYYGPIDARRLV
ncbi:MAG: C40 family peptidase [Nocardiaceae bacterium]|nr:C40 family peptidase [Nocardiaceae bacterium]